MAHEVESLFYVSNEENERFVPWHGLGTPVMEALNSEQAIKKAGLDWLVEPTPIIVNDKELENYKANVRNTDGKVLGIVGNKYKIVQNHEAFSFTDDLIGNNCKYETAGSLLEGRKTFLLARLPRTQILGDDIDPYICFSNTHDGKGSVRCIMTPIRVVCNNTLSLALDTAKRSWSTRHIGDIQSKLEEARRTLGLANKYMEELANTADILANTTLTEGEANRIITEELFPIDETFSDRKKENIENARNNFMVCMISPDILKYKGTAYQMVQAASDYVTHKVPGRNTESFKERNFDNILRGNTLIDTTFLKMLEKSKVA